MKIVKREDINIIWHPFTQTWMDRLPIVIKRGKGSYIYDENNKSYLDLISSWWVNIHGHANSTIAKAIYKQSLNLEHVIFAGFTHDPAISLCKKLKKILPNKLKKFFFSDNGSTAIEVAIKMSYQFWKNKGISTKNIFITFDNGYHGDTFGAMSVSSTPKFHITFKDLCFPIFTVPFPCTWHEDEEVQKKEDYSLSILDKYLSCSHNNVSALIIEPLIQGAGGMNMCRPIFIQKVADLVKKYNILIIFDEIMTGFFRTGTFFAFEQTKTVPDFLCISKGLTGGFLPLALTITTEDVYQTFLDKNNFKKSFTHGHSYTANPLGCAAAIASLNLFKKYKTLKSISDINKIHYEELVDNLSKKQKKYIKNVRIIGTIAAFDLYDKDAQQLRNKCLDHGILIRPLGKSVYILPPYSTTTYALKNAYTKIKKLI